MKTYYNEFDKKKCAALAQLMKDGHITKGDIDDRSIRDVRPEDVRGYDRCHFFAGIGLWDYALQLAEWSDAPVWTGSCPCQPFSSAGRQKGKGDDRHLWPEWFRLVKECRPTTIFGEQVASAITHGWLDDVYQGLESEGYAVGSAVLPACSIGAPHRRERLWFVGHAEHDGRNASKVERSNGSAVQHNTQRQNSTSKFEGTGGSCDVAYGDNSGQRLLQEWRPEDNEIVGCSERSCSVVHPNDKSKRSTARYEERVVNTSGEGKGNSSTLADNECQRPPRSRQLQRPLYPAQSEDGKTGQSVHDSSRYWQNGIWIDCPDGKQRLVEPSIPLLAHGYSERVGVIHCAGDAIVPQVAAEFIRANMP